MERLVQYAMAHVGIPYLWGGDDPIRGFDCSGFVQHILQAAGIDPVGDQNADALYRGFVAKGAKRDCKMVGSLAFYGSPNAIIHVAFMIDSWRVIEAGGGGSATTTLDAAAKANACVRMRPVDYRRDFVESILPVYPAIWKG